MPKGTKANGAAAKGTGSEESTSASDLRGLASSGEGPKANDEADSDDYDEEADDDYDPSKKEEDQEVSDVSDDEAQPDYTKINTGITQVRTRTQRYNDHQGGRSASAHGNGLAQDLLLVNVDEIFRQLNNQGADDWTHHIKDRPPAPSEPATTESHEEKIKIMTTYTFAGKLVRESKEVDINSAEAKAYLNSSSSLISEDHEGLQKSFVTVLRQPPGSEELVPLRIKLKRPSLIDKFLAGDKKNKLTTLEKSRLDWASFVDEKKIKDDLALHNKGGYLEKQDFLGRMEAKRDSQYQRAKELERQREWQQQQSMKS